MKKYLALGLTFLFAALMLMSAVNHIRNPEFYEPMIPSFIPPLFANIVAAIAEALVGIALLIPTYRRWGGLGFFLLMVAFLPIHIWDLMKETPAVGSTNAAIIRLLVQFVLIYAGWWLSKRPQGDS